MGRGSYTASDWSKLRTHRGLERTRATESIFSRSQADKSYDSRAVTRRESRDPDATTSSTPIIIGIDVTASMGYLAKELATNSIHRTVTRLLDEHVVTAPQVMCSAIGDCKSDRSPLQVTQFEADIRIVEQLLDLYLEGGGGGNNGESYHLLWYYAARHTRHDCFEKRQKKGFLFTIGDDRCHDTLRVSDIERTFTSSSPYALSNEELLREAERYYHVFHIHIEKGTATDAAIAAEWQQLMPGRCAVISRKDVDCLHALITAMIAVAQGMSVNDALHGMDQPTAQRIARSMAAIETKPPKTTISF